MGTPRGVRQQLITGVAIAITIGMYGLSRLPDRQAGSPADQGGDLSDASPAFVENSGLPAGIMGTSTAVSDSSVERPVDATGAPTSEQSPTAESASASVPASPAGGPPPRRISLDSVVGLKCYFVGPDECSGVARGTGVIVGADGTVLTARHVVDDVWASACYEGKKSACALDRCEAVRLPDSRTLFPEPERTYPVNPYPYFDLEFSPNNWDFTASVAYVPRLSRMSADEYCALDVAALSFGRWNPDKPDLSRSIAVSPVLASRATPAGALALVPGFAYQEVGGGTAEESRNLSFDRFRLLTTSYVMGGIEVGDAAFAESPLVLTLTSDIADITGGRSGSPVFWNGYVVGLVQSVDTADRRVTRAVAMPAVVDALRAAGFLGLIDAVR